VSETADVVIVGGGVIGAACADALAERDLRVVLIERDHLAAGASGRNQGLFVTPSDPALVPMTLASLERYLTVAEQSPLPVRFDRDPIGFLRVAEGSDEELIELERFAVAAEAAGTKVDRLGADELRGLEPSLAPDLAGGHLFHTGRRLDPTSLTVSLVLRARARGCEVQEHRHVRALLIEGEAVCGVVTDQGPIHADTVVLAAGPWSQELLRPLGIRLAVTPSRGWLVLVDARRQLLSRPVEGGGWWQTTPETMAASTYVEVPRRPTVGTLINPADDGSLSLGFSIELAVADGPEDPDVPREIVRRAIRFVPALADARVVSTWWGVRPMTADDRPIVGRVRDGLVLATGHGTEGVILGAGTGALVRSIVTGEDPPFPAEPFDPARFP
jgi:sarcosine oxidase subunit beta